MKVFDALAAKDHEQVVFSREEGSGLLSIVAIHSTVLGPALGGCRMWTYASEDDALIDVLRLSRGMTYKAAISGLNLGGGKAVILGDPKTSKSEILFRAFGRVVHGLSGRYITAEDVGTTVRDMEFVRMETNFVTGISRSLGGSGDPSPVTAFGTYHGLKACAKHLRGRDSLEGMRVAVQGAGQVGYHLIKHLHRERAKVVFCDTDLERVRSVIKDFRVEAVPPEEIYDLECDIFAPCALGGILNETTIPRLKCAIVGGSANNQLGEENAHGAMLLERSILYAPDYVINAGGLINVANELEGYNQERALKQAAGIYDVLLEVFRMADAEKVAPVRAANSLAMRRIESIGRIKKTFTGTNPPSRNIHVHGVS